MQRFLVHRSDGSVAIMQLIEGTVDQAIAKWPADLRNSVVSYEELKHVDVPAGQTFRDAVRKLGKK